MASITTRVDEANKLLENGHKYLKTGLLKWTPDHDNAANQFQQAAMAFKGAGLHQKAIEANELAIKSYMTSHNSQFQAAKCMEQAALSCKETGDMQAASKYFLRAIDVYRNTGNLDTAISTMERAAKILAESMPTMAADIYIQASEACVIEDRYRQAAEFCNRAAVLYLKAKEYKRAATISREEINCYAQGGDNKVCSRTVMGLVLIHITSNDIVAALDILKTCQMEDDPYYLAQNLITGYEKRDAKLLNTILKNSYFRNLDTEYTRLARDLLEKYGKITEDTPSKPGEQPTHQDDSDLLL